MKITIPEYGGQFNIVSIALDKKAKDDLLREGVEFWFVQRDNIISYPENKILTDNKTVIEQMHRCNNYDVFEIENDGIATRCYDDSSVENGFFITGRCNSNCIMCPSPDYSRQNGFDANINNLITIAEHIPSDTVHLTITGGEPFIVGKDIFRLFEYCRKKFEQTEFLILTNGRVFAINEYCQLFKETIPYNSIVGIPIHGSCDMIHDAITQVRGSFFQTVTGIKRLVKLGIKTELRIVVCKNNVEDMLELAKFIVNELYGIDHVSIMAMEMTGSAYKNENLVWIPYKESFRYVSPAVKLLVKAGIDVRLYNFPLCTVDKGMWTICAKSISSWKVRYSEICEKCIVRESCGGVFAGTFRLENGELEPIL